MRNINIFDLATRDGSNNMLNPSTREGLPISFNNPMPNSNTMDFVLVDYHPPAESSINSNNSNISNCTNSIGDSLNQSNSGILLKGNGFVMVDYVDAAAQTSWSF